MRKAKLIACLSLLPVVSTTPFISSSCSNTTSYTVMDLPSISYVPVPLNSTGENVTLCNGLYVNDNNHQPISIDETKSTYTLDGADKDLISDVQIVKNTRNDTINVLAKAKWDGKDIAIGNIVLNLELVLTNGTPIDCKTNIILRHDYWIDADYPVLWEIKSGVIGLNQFYLREGFDVTPITSGITWKVVSAPEKYLSKFNFGKTAGYYGLLEYSNEESVNDSFWLIVSAEIDDYYIEHELRVVITS